MEKVTQICLSIISILISGCFGVKQNSIGILDSSKSGFEIKITLPDSAISQRNEIIIWTLPPDTRGFISNDNNREIESTIFSKIKESLLSKGFINVEFISQNDSVEIFGVRYLRTDVYTHANNLDSLINYLCSLPNFNNFNVTLIGHSAGCNANAIVAATNGNIAKIVQLSPPVADVKQTIYYQRENDILDIALLITNYGDRDYIDNYLNKLSSLDSHYYPPSLGISDSAAALELVFMTKLFIKEHFEPIDSLCYLNNDLTLTINNIDNYLRQRWSIEDKLTKGFYQDNYELYRSVLLFNIISPLQISLRNFDAKSYYPTIKTPILSIWGSEDKKIKSNDCREAFEKMMKVNRNILNKSTIIDGCNHNLVKLNKGGNNSNVDERVINDIIAWISNEVN